MVKKVKRGVGIGLTFLRFRVYVYAFAGDTRRYRCFDSLTVAHQSRFTSGAIYTGESPFLMTSRPPSLRKGNSVSGKPCIVLHSSVGIGTNGTHSPASLGSKPTASSSKIWFSGRARVVSYDHGLYRYYITSLSAIYLLCPSPRLSILYCGIYVSRVEEIRTVY